MLKNYTRVEVNEYGNKVYLNDKRQPHRLDGPAIERKIGSKFWFINGKKHRNIDYYDEWHDKDKRWCFKNDYHRIGGVAYYDRWYIRGKFYTKKEYYNIVWSI